jgi:hypothetical protein
MKAALNSSIRARGCGSSTADELRQEGQEEDRQFRIEDVDQDRGHDDAPAGARRGRRARVDRKRAGLAQRLPGHVEQIHTPHHFSAANARRLVCSTAANPEHGGQHMRHDPERAAKGRRKLGRAPDVSATASV